MSESKSPSASRSLSDGQLEGGNETPADNCLPAWGSADLPAPPSSNLRSWVGLIGPGLVMCGIQLAGGEWLLGSEITARYGGDLMWVAGLAILFQVFYNLECGRYAVYCGEPIMTGFMRKRPGPRFWIGFVLLLNLSAIIPGLSTQGAAALAALFLDRPPGEADRGLVMALAFVLLGAVSLPILVGGKIYNMLQWVMTTKVVVVLTFCILIGITLVSRENWWDVFSGFLKVGSVPVVRGEDINGNGILDPGEDFDQDGRLDQVESIQKVDVYGKVTEFTDADGDGKWDGENVENVFMTWSQTGQFPTILLTQIALLGAFAGYAGGGGLANATYSNFVRDKGWGMGEHVGAIASAVGGRRITLSHLGKIFPKTPQNMERWRGWWRHLLKDQVIIWAPGCVMGMALPALLSLQFAHYSPLFSQTKRLDWSQAIIAADGMRHASELGIWLPKILWWSALVVGLLVLLPSQMSIVEDFRSRP